MKITTFLVLTGLCYVNGGSQEPKDEISRDPGTIHSPEYPNQYPKVSHSTWIWSRERGFWGVQFTHVDLNCETDRIIVSDGRDYMFQPITVCEQHTKLYTSDSYLRIEFESNTTHPRSGFVITVRYGLTIEDLDKQFLSLVTPPPRQKHDSGKSNHLIPILLAVLVTVAVVATLLFIGVWLISRRRLQPHQAISLSVNVHGINIRRGSGIRHARKTSSQSDSEDVTPTNSSQPIRRLPSESSRSWSVRAHTEVRDGYISPSHANAGMESEAAVDVARTTSSEEVHAVPNMYIPLETLLISTPEDKGGPKSQALVGRAYNLNLTTPKTTSATRPSLSDDGYMKMESQFQMRFT
ncbi:uncharacterized protein LOC121366696 [Gigantopelta aegis]|uniref:uncharacterized protein LOC121366696 n=1 Tax=Gigantopelta aegis TaxID=1735272 RepID=UPI001B88C347|nr:uncharacterized protein LOC121366696 [Gigantopelta aegis]